MDSGSSKGGREGKSGSRPRMPSGETCTEELLVMIWVVSGDMIGEACTENEEVLMAEDGTEV